MSIINDTNIMPINEKKSYYQMNKAKIAESNRKRRQILKLSKPPKWIQTTETTYEKDGETYHEITYVKNPNL
jgi:hypothetical protein